MSEGAKQLLTEKLLRTMAAVPYGQSVVAIADDGLVMDLDRLGFAVSRMGPGRALADSSHDWGVVVLEDESWRDSVEVAVGMTGKIRDGGWIFVGTVGNAIEVTRHQAARQLADTIGNSLAIAEEALLLYGETDVAVSAILRRIGPATRP